MYDELVKELRHLDEYSKQINPTPSGIFREAADAIEELARRCEQFQYMPPPAWIPVTEKLPQISHTVLVAGRMKYRWEHKYLQFVDVAFFNEREFFETFNDWYEGQDEFEITHWMPLPPPPEEE